MQNQNTPPQNNPFSGSYNTGEDMVAYEPLSPGSAVSPQAQNLNQSIIQEVPDDGVLESDYIAQQKAQPAPSISNPIPSQSYSMPDFHTSGRDIGNKFMYIVGFALIAFILLIGGGFLVFNKAGNSVVKSPDIEVPEQAVDLGEIVQTTDELSTIKPSQNAKTVILNGDVISTGSVSLYQNGNQGKISLGQIDNNQNYTLPNSSGVFCLDSNNCNFADVNNVVNSIGGVNGILALGGGLSIQGNTLISAIGEAGITTSINSLIGQISIQGTSNQVNVATSSNVITLTTPQSIATSSSPTFQTITLATPGTQNGNIICDISNNCGYAGGGNAFVQNGNS
ncbi:hypothetical protein KDA00_04515, partial [Candidatus Saccharibacteria bacterium]|nr:hypothetical protein [Candidatus Saccharibacteria bacterium]